MNRSLIATATLLSITLIIVAATSLGVSAQTTIPLIMQLKYLNGTSLDLNLSNERVTVVLWNATLTEVFRDVLTNETGHIVLSTKFSPSDTVNMMIWWNASWGVSYIVNVTTNVALEDLNTSIVNCSIYNVRLKAVDNTTAYGALPYARTVLSDVEAKKVMYDVTTNMYGLTGFLRLPAPLLTDGTINATYRFKVVVYWTPTTPVSMVSVYNVTWYPADIQTASTNTATAPSFCNNTVCSVYRIVIRAGSIVTMNNVNLSSQGDLFAYACIYSDGILMSEQARIDNGGTSFRVATYAIPEQPGSGTLQSYEFRVYWRWERPSVEYLVNVSANLFDIIDDNKDISDTIYTDTVAMAIELLDKSNNPLTVYDVALTFPVYGYTLSTSTGTGGAPTGYVDFSAIVGTGNETYPSYWLPLPWKHNGTVLNYRIKATFEGIPVLDKTFNLTDYVTWKTLVDNVKVLNFTCNVYWVSFNLLDAHDKLLSGIASLKVTYPDYGVTLSFQVLDGAGGRRMPGGSGLTATIDYKDVEGLPLLEPASFNINDTSTSIALKFPVYNLVVYVYDWYGEVKLEKFNCTITFTKGLWNGITQIASYNDALKSHTFEQMPAGGTYAINVSTRTDGTTPGLNASGAIGKLLARVTVTMPASDYVTDVRVPLYNPTFVIKAADGSDIPAYLANLTYIVVKANTSTIEPEPIFVNNTVQITYESNQTLGVCFVGGWVYPLRVYVAGVLVYGEAVKLPADTDVVELRVNLYGSTIRVLTYDGSYPIPNMCIRFGWTGLNVTALTASELLGDLSNYFNYFKSVTTDTNVIAYNTSKAVTNADGVAKLWVPVWNVSGLNYTTIVYGVYTIPGVTGGVPSTAPVVQVAPYDDTWIGIMGKLVNITGAEDVGDVKVYACNFYVEVLDYLNRPLANYTVFVNGTYVAGTFKDVIATSKTNATGVASFTSGVGGIFFFANYTYVVNAFEEGTPYPQMVRASLCANWSQDYVVTVNFPGALIIKALDWSGAPLVGATVKLFWASGPWAGGLTAIAKTDKDGVAVINMVDTVSYYTVEVWFKGSLVNQKYRLEEQLRFPEGVNVFSYTERMLVFNPKMMFVSDLGTALPAGIDIEVKLPDGSTVKAKTDAAGSVILSQVPIGKCTVRATWEGVGIYASDLWISSDAPLVLKTTVYEVTISVVSRRGTPLAGATVEFVYPSGRAETVTLDSEGKSPRLLVATSPTINVLRISKVTWAGVPLSLETFRAAITASGPVTFRAINVYALKVSVVGAVGQLLDGASVVVLKDGKVVASMTAKGGIAEVELPEGDYTIQASYLGKTGVASVSLTRDIDAKVALDVYMVIAGQAFSLGEIVLWIIMAIIIIIVLAAIIVALTRIRRKPAATPSTKETTVKT
ncbi:MAG: hypothetical protein QXP95_02920 [Candidatus Nezhaarchaeales archaeon]